MAPLMGKLGSKPSGSALVAFRSLNDDVIHRPPEIADVGAQGGLLPGIEIAHFRGLDLLQRFRKVIIKGRDESGFETDAPLLQFRGIEAEVVAAEGAHAHQFDIAAHPVPEAGQLVEPVAAQEASQGGHAEVVTEFSPCCQVVMLVDILLDELAVGVHRPELVYFQQLPVLSHTQKMDQRSVCGVLVVEGHPFFLSGKAVDPIVADLFADGESGGAEATHDFRAAHHVAGAIGQAVPDLPEGRQLGQHPHQQVVKEIIDPIDHRGVLMHDPFPALIDRFGADHQQSPLLQAAVGHLQEMVDVPGAVQRVDADDVLLAVLGKGEERSTVGGVDDQTAVTILREMALEELPQDRTGFPEGRLAQQGLP